MYQRVPNMFISFLLPLKTCCSSRFFQFYHHREETEMNNGKNNFFTDVLSQLRYRKVTSQSSQPNRTIFFLTLTYSEIQENELDFIS